MNILGISFHYPIVKVQPRIQTAILADAYLACQGKCSLVWMCNDYVSR